MSLVTIGRPEDIDLAVPPLTPGQPSGQTLRQIVDGYSQWVTKDWARACNVEYRAGPSGPSVSLIAEAGKIWTTGDPRWPVMLMMKTGPLVKESPTEAELRAARWAFGAGPWLVRNGQACDVAAEIARVGFSGLMESSPRERAAIGIREDGCLVHYATMSATLPQVAFEMLSRGCRDAIGLDGGGSVCVMDASGKVFIGYTARQVCCALIFRRLVESSNPVPEPKGGDKQMIVCIDPGHGGPDPGAVSTDGIQEKHIALAVSKRVAEYLRRGGVEAILTRTTDTDLSPGLDDAKELMARAKIANDVKADYFVSIHANAAADQAANGFEAFHWPNSAKGIPLAHSIARQHGIASGMPLRRVTSATFAILGYVTGPAVLVELGFLTNKTDLALLREPAFLDKCALGIAYGILAART